MFMSIMVELWAWIASHSLWIWVSALLHILGFLFVVFHCLLYRREATSSVLWMFAAWSFPIIGPVLFLSFGMNRVHIKGLKNKVVNQALLKERLARETHPEKLECLRRAHETFSSKTEKADLYDLNLTMDRLLPGSPLLKGNSVRILVSGDESYEPMLDAIDRASHHIHLQTFIFSDDAVGRKFVDRLVAKARSGVGVRLIYDRFGSSYAHLSGFFNRFDDVPGIQMIGWSQVSPLKRQFQVNLRNHRKLLIVDGKTAFTGGINIQDENITTSENPAIRDYHFEFQGPIVHELQYSFLQDWYFMTAEEPDTLLRKEHFPEVKSMGDSLVRIINAGPSSDVEVLTDILCSALASAKREVLAVTPYFVPTADIVRAFRLAALRGVKVHLIIPRINNHTFVSMASHALYDDLLSHGVRIYHRPPPFMHAKGLIIDDDLAIVGSANLDARSLRLNYETDLAIFDSSFVKTFKKTVLQDLELSEEVMIERWRKRSKIVQMTENFCSLLSPVL